MKRICFILLLIFLFSQVQAYAEDAIYTDEKYGFSIAYPLNCRALKNYRGALITIFFPKISFFDFFNGAISINVRSVRSADRPLEELVDIYFKYSKSVLEKEKVIINDIKFLSVIQTQKMFLWNLKLHHLITVKGTKIFSITYIATVNNYDKHINKAKDIMHTFKFVEHRA